MTQAKTLNNGTTNVDHLADSARSLVSEAAQTARGKLENAREQVEDVASRAADAAGRLSKQARGGLQKVGEAVAELVRERPFVALGTAFVAGYITISLLRR